MATPVMIFTKHAVSTRFYAGLVMLMTLLLVNAETAQAQTKATINRKTKSFDLVANIRLDHRIYGYAAPDTLAKKLILFSIFTYDVEGNPHHCPLGAYYETSKLPAGSDIRFVSVSPGFVKLTYLAASKQATTFYIRQKFVRFD